MEPLGISCFPVTIEEEEDRLAKFKELMNAQPDQELQKAD